MRTRASHSVLVGEAFEKLMFACQRRGQWHAAMRIFQAQGAAMFGAEGGLVERRKIDGTVYF
eukprot:1118580-Pyramimonas_sp.AAC.1